MRRIIVAAMAAWAACALPIVSHAQSFEVASIRLHDGLVQMVGLTASGPRVTISAFSVSNLVEYAYDVKMYQVAGGPAWATTERYDIVAKAPGDAAVTGDQIPPMVQALLAERFHAAVHREMREMPVYALVVGGKGPRLKESAPDASPMLRMGGPRGVIQITTTKGSMGQLVDQLSGSIGRPVLDQTGLTGTYDYTLEWAGDYAPPDANAPSVFAAVEEQLGLKLESTKAPIEVVIIDHIEKPSSN
jgi:uncharacterized protein (TIGR03435 family)